MKQHCARELQSDHRCVYGSGEVTFVGQNVIVTRRGPAGRGEQTNDMNSVVQLELLTLFKELIGHKHDTPGAAQIPLQFTYNVHPGPLWRVRCHFPS